MVYILYAQKKIGFKMARVYANMFVNHKHMGCGYGSAWKNVIKNCPEQLLSDDEELPRNLMNIV